MVFVFIFQKLVASSQKIETVPRARGSIHILHLILHHKFWILCFISVFGLFANPCLNSESGLHT